MVFQLPVDRLLKHMVPFPRLLLIVFISYPALTFRHSLYQLLFPTALQMLKRHWDKVPEFRRTV